MWWGRQKYCLHWDEEFGPWQNRAGYSSTRHKSERRVFPKCWTAGKQSHDLYELQDVLGCTTNRTQQQPCEATNWSVKVWRDTHNCWQTCWNQSVPDTTLLLLLFKKMIIITDNKNHCDFRCTAICMKARTEPTFQWHTLNVLIISKINRKSKN